MWVIFSKYIVVGLANTLLTMIVIFTLMHSGVNLYISNAVGYMVGIIFSFIMNSLFTFSKQLSFASLIKFFTACFISYLVNLLAIKSFLIIFSDNFFSEQLLNMECCTMFPVKVYLAQLFGMGCYTVTGFVLNKLWVMK